MNMDETAAPVAATPAAAPAAAPTNESISEKMERLGWEPEAKHDANPNALGAKAREAAKERRPAKAKAEPAAAATDAAPTEAAPTVAETKEALEKSDPLARKREYYANLLDRHVPDHELHFLPDS